MIQRSSLQSFGVKLFLLGGTLGCLVVAGLLPNPSQSPHSDESATRQTRTDPSPSVQGPEKLPVAAVAVRVDGESAIRQTKTDPLVQRPEKLPVAATAVRVDLNQSSIKELQTLPGIGPVLAERIHRYRRDNGNFTSVQEITKVRGIGAKRFARLRPHVVVRRQGVSHNG